MTLGQDLKAEADLVKNSAIGIQEGQDSETGADKCMGPPAPIAEKDVKSLLSLRAISLFTVAIVLAQVKVNPRAQEVPICSINSSASLTRSSTGF